MEKVIILTGATGHVGNSIITLFKEREMQKEYDLIALIHSYNKNIEDSENIKYIKGDMKDKESLRALFEEAKNKEIYVIHCAAIVSIENKLTQDLIDVNVNGTSNILELSEEYKVKRFIYVSSVHALDCSKKGIIYPQKDYDPSLLKGGYAKSKAMATKLVLSYINEGKINGLIVQPSGIIGPYFLNEANNLVKMINKYISGKLRFGVKGGYDFVDSRDVSSAILSALTQGNNGETYILSGHHYSIKEIFDIIRKYANVKKSYILPIWVAKLAVPFVKIASKITRKKALYTSYSLYVLKSNDAFDNSNSIKDLDFNPRNIEETLKDTIKYLNETYKKL